MSKLGSPLRQLVVVAFTLGIAILSSLSSPGLQARQATLQQLPIFGAQATPDPSGRGPGFPSIEVENVDVCTTNCGYLADEAYSFGERSAGAHARIGNIASIAEVEATTGVAATWTKASLSGDHQWGNVCLTAGFAPSVTNRCTNSWLNYRADDTSVRVGAYFPSFRYRVRFTVPSFPRDEQGNAIAASMNVKMKVDNWGKVWINGAPVDHVIWGTDSVDASALFAQTVHEGVNTIELVAGDGGGLAGFTFLIELSMFADDPLTESPAGDGDADGVPDDEDAFPENPNESRDSDGDGTGDNGDAFPNDPTEWRDTDGDGVGDNGDAFPNDPSESRDSDGDGVGDNADAYPHSNLSPTVAVEACVTGVWNLMQPNGASFNDLIGSALSGSANQGAKVSAVSALSNGWKSSGLISGRDHGAIVSCVARSK